MAAAASTIRPCASRTRASPWLRVLPELVRGAECLLGAAEVSDPKADLAQLAEAERGDRAPARALKLLAGRANVALRGRPVTAQVKYLGVVDAADPREP